MKKLSAIKSRSQLREIKPFSLLLLTTLSFVQEQPCSLSTLVTPILLNFTQFVILENLSVFDLVLSGVKGLISQETLLNDNLQKYPLRFTIWTNIDH